MSTDESVPNDADLTEVAPLERKWSKKVEASKKGCVPERDEFIWLARRAEDLYELPNPEANRIRMAYWMKGAKAPNRTIDVWADGRFVVRIKGMIGYPGNDPKNVKFKFGAYRDKFKYGPPRSAPPNNASMLVNEILVTKSKHKAVSGCK